MPVPLRPAAPHASAVRNDSHVPYDLPASYLHYFTHNPYQQMPPPQPVPVAHKVWILDCRSCGLFLTNRGMKAVLLLRPNVSLYSSDALPVNCSAYSSNPEALRPQSTCRPVQVTPRSCECLTQTLCCHGCGATVGYMIVIPCSRCTSSITSTNRATNGHRFVFHASEIVGSERHYILDEPGVIPVEPSLSVAPSSSTLLFPTAMHTSVHRDTHPNQWMTPNHFPVPFRHEYLPSPPLDTADSSPASSTATSPIISQYPFNNEPRRNTSEGSDQSPSPVTSMSTVEQPVPRKLKPGDILYWHHLSRHGEIPGVSDDPRSRKPPSSQRTPLGR